jgi:hypothetical protein
MGREKEREGKERVDYENFLLKLIQQYNCDY